MNEGGDPRTRRACRSRGLSVERMASALLLTGIAAGQVTSRVSVDSAGMQGDGYSKAPSISADGRYVAFESVASDLVPGDTNGVLDIFVRDRQTGTIERVSVGSDGTEANDMSLYPSISADGRWVAFLSAASNLVPGDTNGVWDMFVHDRQTGATERVSVDSAGAQADESSFSPPSISADGRYVAFQSAATDLVPADTNGVDDVFVHDRQTGTTERVSVSSAGVQSDAFSGFPSISADGRCVAFASLAGLVPGDTNGHYDVFVRDRQSSTTERVSVRSNGAQGNGDSGVGIGLTISGDGRYVAFASDSSNLVPGDTNAFSDTFVHDRRLGTTERVSVSSAGAQGDHSSGNSAAVSADGRYVAFLSAASTLVPGDTNGAFDIFVRDRRLGTTERVSVDSSGAQGNLDSDISGLSISADGRFVAFASDATNLVTGDTNGATDVFVRDRSYAPFTSSCDPGVAGVLGCPCSNPPSASGHGCDNSSGTGGAIVWASGVAYLSADSLVFTTDLEPPTALSIVMQGNAGIPAGVPYGQGVRCLGGTVIRRLYVKPASAGSITAPDFAAGDPQVTVRSAEKGDVIQPGQSRWYLVYYRDPIVLGGCPASSTFNATQTGRVDWSF
jgi:Tol biopolymer transport system component